MAPLSETLSALPQARAFAKARPRLARLLSNVLEGAGVSPSSLRRSIALGGEPPPTLRAYLDKLTRHAFRITDEDVAGLRASGHSEDAILELSVAGALGAALLRLERGLAASHAKEG